MTGHNQNDDVKDPAPTAKAAATHRTPASTQPERDWGQIGLVVLVILAVVASVVMLLADSEAAQRIALLAALWAAVVGFFLVTRYRRQVVQREEEMAHREQLHAAELDKARTAFAAGDDTLADIRQQLTTIREQLEELSGREFTYEPAALRANARRIQELEQRTDALDDSVSESVAESAVNFTQASTGRPSADAIAGRLGTTPTTPRQDNPLAELINERKAAADTVEPKPFDTGSFQAVRWTGQQEQSTRSVAEEKHGKHEAPATPVSEGRRGRRRSDEKRSGAVSVAELLAAAKKDKKDS